MNEIIKSKKKLSEEQKKVNQKADEFYAEFYDTALEQMGNDMSTAGRVAKQSAILALEKMIEIADCELSGFLDKMKKAIINKND